MFRARTVLILGAGASCEVGLPSGVALLKGIRELLDFKYRSRELISGDAAIDHALYILASQNRELSPEKLIEAARKIRAASVQAMSIDNLIDALEDPHVAIVGKLAIVRAIHLAEKNSEFFQHTEVAPFGLNFDRFEHTWYSYFAKILFDDVRLSNIEDIFTNLSLIIFNYDRCLEYYLLYAIQNYYGTSQETAQKLVNGLPIYRPYGIAGCLPWQNANGPTVDFGGGNTNDLVEIAHKIRTFTESNDDHESAKQMKDSIRNADRVVFLGFGFHRQNMNMLSTVGQSHAEFLATVRGVSKSDADVIRRQIAAKFNYVRQHRVKGGSLDYITSEQIMPSFFADLADYSCCDLFGNYWRTLTAPARQHA